MKQPIAYVKFEGGAYVPWVDGGERRPECVHAIVFEDGSVFDTQNGWRLEPLPHEQVERIKEALRRLTPTSGGWL